MLLVLLAATLIYLLRFESGSAMLWRAGVQLLQGTLSGTYVSGTITNGLHLRNVKYRAKNIEVDIDDIDGRWNLVRTPPTLSIEHLHLGTVNIRLADSQNAPASLPADLRLPLALNIKALTITELNLRQGLLVNSFHALSAHGQSDGTRHSVVLEHVTTPYGETSAVVQLNGVKPFALVGTGTMDGTAAQDRYSLHAKIDGTLEKLTIELNATGDKLSGQAVIRATPFAAVPFERLEINADHINPRAFNAEAPNADLTLHAALAPDAATPIVATVPGDQPNAAHSGFPAVSGSVSIVNAQPGTIDAGKLPLESVKAMLRLDGRAQKLTQMQIKLSGKATMEGMGELQQQEDGKNNAIGEFRFNVAGLNLHALHAKLQDSSFNGPLNIKLQAGKQEVALKLEDPRLGIALDAQIDSDRVTLRTAQLSAGAARLNLSGTMTRDVRHAYALQGKLTQFDPALWIKNAVPRTSGKISSKDQTRSEPKHMPSAAIASTGKAVKTSTASPQGNAIHGRINMDFTANGALTPEFQTAMKFALHDSEYGGLPMSGAGHIALAGKRLLPSEMQLSAVGNDLSVQGSFGRPDDHLKLNLNAPQLERLGIGMSGSLFVDAEIQGTMARPDMHAAFHGERLSMGSQQLGAMSGRADIRGDLTDSAHALSNTNVSAKFELHDYIGSGLRLDHGEATLGGTYGNHTLALSVSGSAHGNPLNLSLATQGRLTQSADGTGWDGIVSKLENRGLPQVVSAAPFALSVSSQRLAIGAAKFAVLDSTLDLKKFNFDHGSLSSEGSAGAVSLAKILQLQQELAGVTSPLKTNLVFDASWKFSTAGKGDGFVELKRREGDITVDPGRGDVALGLSDLHLHAALQANRVQLDAQAAASRVGTMTLQAQIPMDTRDGSAVLYADQALTAQLKLAVPNLKTVGALFGPRYAIDGAINASLSASGTLAEPVLSGTIDGDKLAVTLYDQGIRLHDGIARLILEKNVVTLQALEFHSGDGMLKAEGQVQVGQSNPDLHARIVADHLQLFASPDRELTLSGQASLASVSEQLHVDGKVVVDHAQFDFPKSSAPQLGDDIVIVHNSGKVEAKPIASEQERMAKAGTRPAGRFAPVVDLAIDLGDDFRFRGTGADLKLSGNLAIHSEPYRPLNATGTVQVESGTYEAFGRKLAIERGVLNFQGPLDNPNIDILAMRRNQDVEAGVEVTGLARRPRTKLVSEPDVVDEEKLSWLMFGHGSESNGVGQQQAAAAALGLLGNAGGKSLAKGIGLDTFSIGKSESGLNDQQVVNVGKAISEKFVVGYEQSLTGAASIAKLTWQVSRRWSLVLRAGAINGFDVLFSLRYD